MKQALKKLIRQGAKSAMASPRGQRTVLQLRRVWSEVQAEQRQAQAAELPAAPPGYIEADLPEIAPVLPRPSVLGQGRPRINLLLPFLSAPHIFGGAATALRTFDRLRELFPAARIIATDEIAPALRQDDFYSRWPIRDHLDPDLEEDHIVGLGKRVGRSLAVRPNDVFLATIWYSAHIGFGVQHWQDAHYGIDARARRMLVYLIQDYEPGFYPWSTRYALADATYRHADRTLAILNTGILSSFFDAQGYRFAARQVLEPRLNPHLARLRTGVDTFAKGRTILVYGRPSIDRNMFPLIVLALRLWAQRYPQARQWELLSAGESFADMELGNGCVLRCQGKTSLDDYAQLLSRSAIGVSLMVSPHPSYPPLEMAAFGMRVVSNSYANKDLAHLSPQIRSLERSDPEALAAALAQECEAFERQLASFGGVSCRIERSSVAWNGPFLDGGDELEGLAASVRQLGLLGN